MQLTIPLTGKVKLLLGVIVLVFLGGIGSVFFLKSNPTPEQLREKHLALLEAALEAYFTQHGAYPEPAARGESFEGISHVWGYRPQTPSFASCTVHFKEKSGEETQPMPDAEQSSCGGNIYDREGNLIGWKGTLNASSALNSIEVASQGEGRLSTPFGDTLKDVPLDPTYMPFPALTSLGFGEYVYAVRAPLDGAEGKGGMQYQIAATFKNPATGKLQTSIRGNYFVRSEEKDLYPPSLIGPGILFDSHGNPEPGKPLHVLLDGQQEGFPIPLLGEGESILRLLTLRSRALKMQEEVDRRREILGEFSEGSPSTEHLLGALDMFRDHLHSLLTELPGGKTEPSGENNVPLLEEQFSLEAKNFENAIHTFLEERNEEVHAVLLKQSKDGEGIRVALSGALLSIGNAHTLLLLARDELLKYLDGEGIEEQARDRAGRRIESALDALPDASTLFAGDAHPLPPPFLSDDLQKDLSALQPSAAGRGGTGSGMALPEASMPMLSTISSELTILLGELRSILKDIQDDLADLSVPVEETDSSVRRLARALGTERDRITELFSRVGGEEEAKSILAEFEAMIPTLAGSGSVLAEEDLVHAIGRAAELSGEHGDFSGLLFSSASLDTLAIEAQAGVPDLTLHENSLEAEYQGIPYPLP